MKIKNPFYLTIFLCLFSFTPVKTEQIAVCGITEAECIEEGLEYCEDDLGGNERLCTLSFCISPGKNCSDYYQVVISPPKDQKCGPAEPECEENQFFEEINFEENLAICDFRSCNQCSEGCAECEGNENCISCEYGLVKGPNGECQECSQNCSNCPTEGSNNQECQQCSGLNRDPTKNCACSEGYFEDENGSCQDCPIGCLQCNQDNTCTLCSDPERSGPNCEICIDGKYLDNQNTCQNCNQNCETCQGDADSCLSCKDILGDVNNSCQCDSTISYQENGICQCTGSYRDREKNCGCLDGYFEDLNLQECTECSEKCIGCENSADNCVLCSDPQKTPETDCDCEIGYKKNENGECVELENFCVQFIEYQTPSNRTPDMFFIKYLPDENTNFQDQQCYSEYSSTAQTLYMSGQCKENGVFKIGVQQNGACDNQQQQSNDLPCLITEVDQTQLITVQSTHKYRSTCDCEEHLSSLRNTCKRAHIDRTLCDVSLGEFWCKSRPDIQVSVKYRIISCENCQPSSCATEDEPEVRKQICEDFKDNQCKNSFGQYLSFYLNHVALFTIIILLIF